LPNWSTAAITYPFADPGATPLSKKRRVGQATTANVRAELDPLTR